MGAGSGGDDLYRKLLNSGTGQKVFRRKKSHQGADWTPERSSALSGDGVWCPACNKRHGYKTETLQTNYERRGGIWYLMWICGRTGDYLKDQPLGTGVSNVQLMDKKESG